MGEELLQWKIDQHGAELAGLREELHAHYLTQAEMTNIFVTREERSRQAVERREWPVALATIACALAAIANVLVSILGR
jgi:hypothetical protein